MSCLGKVLKGMFILVAGLIAFAVLVVVLNGGLTSTSTSNASAVDYEPIPSFERHTFVCTTQDVVGIVKTTSEYVNVPPGIRAKVVYPFSNMTSVVDYQEIGISGRYVLMPNEFLRECNPPPAPTAVPLPTSSLEVLSIGCTQTNVTARNVKTGVTFIIEDGLEGIETERFEDGTSLIIINGETYSMPTDGLQPCASKG